MFTACSACTFLKNLLDKTPRSDTEIVMAIRKRLGDIQLSMVVKTVLQVSKIIRCLGRKALCLPGSAEIVNCTL